MTQELCCQSVGRVKNKLFLCDASPWIEHTIQQGRVESVSPFESRYRHKYDLYNARIGTTDATPSLFWALPPLDSVELLELRAGETRDL
jgi:hypothetical protein